MVQIIKFLADEEGTKAFKYGLLAAIAATMVISLTNLGRVIF